MACSQKSEHLKIGLFGLYGTENMGNEATLAATMNAIRKHLPNAQIYLISSPPKARAELTGFAGCYDHDPFPISNIIDKIRPFRIRKFLAPLVFLLTEPLRLHRIRRVAKSIGLFLVAGTGIADDFYQRPWDVPLSIARWCNAVQLSGGKIRFLSIGAGPVSNWLSTRWFRQALELADYRSYRDISSKKFATEIGLKTGLDPIMPDMVFSLSSDSTSYDMCWPPKTLALGLMSYKGWNEKADVGKLMYKKYRDKIILLAEKLLSRGYCLKIILGNRKSDMKIFNDLQEALRANANFSNADFCAMDSHADVMKKIKSSDLVIATRFHNVLKALLVGRPVISLGYASKNRDLMKEFGIGHFSYDVDGFSVDEILREIDVLASNPLPSLKEINNKVNQYKIDLEEQFKMALKI